ncbi:MAG: hypothetical protein RRY29_10550 [Desulfovibrionaceae bacterium]
MAQPYAEMFAEEEQQAQEMQAARERAALHRANALNMLLEHKSGRIFLRDFMNFCGVFASPSLKSHDHVQFTEGLRLAGMYVFSALLKHDVNSVSKIFNAEEHL